MLKSISQGFSKFFTNERIVVLVIFLILVWGLLAYSGSKNKRVDTFGVSDVFGTSAPISSSNSKLNSAAPVSNSMEEKVKLEAELLLLKAKVSEVEKKLAALS